MLLPCRLQTKEGEKAKALTMAEFIDTMKELNRQCTAALRAATGDPEATPLYIYDTVALQQNAPMGIDWTQHVKTPAHSPDFNKPIEHCWGQIKRKLLDRLYWEHNVLLTPELAREWVLEAWNSITQDSVERDVKSLKDTWLIVKSRLGVEVTTSKNEKIQGSGGDYPPSATYR
jgi:hypothetical protein